MIAGIAHMAWKSKRSATYSHFTTNWAGEKLHKKLSAGRCVLYIRGGFSSGIFMGGPGTCWYQASTDSSTQRSPSELPRQVCDLLPANLPINLSLQRKMKKMEHQLKAFCELAGLQEAALAIPSLGSFRFRHIINYRLLAMKRTQTRAHGHAGKAASSQGCSQKRILISS